MLMFRPLLAAAALSCAALAAPSTNEGGLIDVLEERGFNCLLYYIRRAGLEDRLRETEGPLTLFAPSEEAMLALPEYLRRFLDGAPEFLAQVLLYHTVPAAIPGSAVANEVVLPTVNGAGLRLNVYKDGSVVTAAGVPISATDVMASNGVIHVIEGLMLPIPSGSMMDEIRFDPTLSTLSEFLERAGLDAVLSAAGNLTLFAPSNAAFADLPDEVLDDLLANPEKLRAVLLYHVVGNTMFSLGLEEGPLTTLQGDDITISVIDGDVLVNNAKVQDADITVSNGVMHFIDRVLVPAE